MLLAAKCNAAELLRPLVAKLPLLSGGYLAAHIKDNKVVKIIFERFCFDLKDRLNSELNYAESEETEINLVASTSEVLFRPTIDSVLYTSMLGEIIIESLYAYLSEKGWTPQSVDPKDMILDIVTVLYENEASCSISKTAELLAEASCQRNIVATDLIVAITQLRECCINTYIVFVSKLGSLRLFEKKSSKGTVLVAIPSDLLTYYNVLSALETYLELKICSKDKPYIITALRFAT